MRVNTHSESRKRCAIYGDYVNYFEHIFDIDTRSVELERERDRRKNYSEYELRLVRRVERGAQSPEITFTISNKIRIFDIDKVGRERERERGKQLTQVIRDSPYPHQTP